MSAGHCMEGFYKGLRVKGAAVEHRLPVQIM